MPRDPEDDSTVQTDLFALGSTLCEIMTGTQPYYDLEDDVVEAKFNKGTFRAWTRLFVVVLYCSAGRVWLVVLMMFTRRYRRSSLFRVSIFRIDESRRTTRHVED